MEAVESILIADRCETLVSDGLPSRERDLVVAPDSNPEPAENP